jgi:hypothetical protein
MLKKFKNENVATEAKATAVTAHKKRNASRTLTPKERAGKAAKKSKPRKVER